MELLHEVILSALRNIDPSRIRLSTLSYEGTTIPEPRYQERTFAYELFHQLRKLEEADSEDLRGFTQQAEVDKGYQGIDYVPDLIVHKPGQTNDNLTACEFKLAIDPYVPYDLAKLQFFVESIGYEEAFMILIGDDSSIQKVANLRTKYDREDGTSIGIMLYNYDINQERIAVDSTIRVKLAKPSWDRRNEYYFLMT